MLNCGWNDGMPVPASHFFLLGHHPSILRANNPRNVLLSSPKNGKIFFHFLRNPWPFFYGQYIIRVWLLPLIGQYLRLFILFSSIPTLPCGRPFRGTVIQSITFDSIIFINQKQPKMHSEIFRCSFLCLFLIFLVSNIPTLVNSTHFDEQIKTEETSEIGQNSGNGQIVTVENPNLNQNVEEIMENSSSSNGSEMVIADNNLEAGSSSSISETESWVDLVPIPIKYGYGRPIYDKDGQPIIDFDFKKSGKKIKKELQKEEEYPIGAEITDGILDDEIHSFVHSMIGHRKSVKKGEKEFLKEEENNIGNIITDGILNDEIHSFIHSMASHGDGAPANENLHPDQIHSHRSTNMDIGLGSGRRTPVINLQANLADEKLHPKEVQIHLHRTTDNGLGGSRRTPGPEANLQTNPTVENLHPMDDQIQSPHSSDNGLESGRQSPSHSVESVDFSIGSNNSIKFLNDLDVDSPHSMHHSPKFSSSKHLSPKQKLHRRNSFRHSPVEIEEKRPKILTRSRSDINQRGQINSEESDSPLKKRQKIGSSSSSDKAISGNDNEIILESPKNKLRKSLADFLKLSPSSKKSSPSHSFDQKKKVEIDDKKQPCSGHPFVKFGWKWMKKAINICRICVLGPGNYAKELEKGGKNGGLQKN